MALFIWEAPLEADVAGLTLDFDCSLRDEFLAFTGILPDIYLAARPAPGLIGGSRRAITDVERGIMVVSSSYSGTMLIPENSIKG